MFWVGIESISRLCYEEDEPPVSDISLTTGQYLPSCRCIV
jgi:hypothetical protein